MIKDIVKDEEFLKIPGVKATVKDKQVAIDLLDTLEHHSDSCVGLAANMIGHSLNIIAVNEYEDHKFKKKSKKLSGFSAQIVQHEVDHLHGIII